MTRRHSLPVLLALLAAAGCGASSDRDEARATVERFYAAVGQDDGEAACAELAEPLLEQVESQSRQPCRGAIARFEYEGGEITRTEVYVKNAKVDLSSGESAFLSREPDGWKLSAVACSAEQGKPADRPLECEVES
jgi:hypothetical protein